jgi:hypothetical protein
MSEYDHSSAKEDRRDMPEGEEYDHSLAKEDARNAASPECPECRGYEGCLPAPGVGATADGFCAICDGTGFLDGRSCDD